MMSALISASIFLVGLVVGYALRIWRSSHTSRRAARPTPITTFGHVRRAF